MKTRKCRNCNTAATFGFAYDKIRIFCAKHREKDTFNLTKRKCLLCERLASFGYCNGPCAVYCSKHKQIDMIHTSKRTKDVVVI